MWSHPTLFQIIGSSIAGIITHEMPVTIRTDEETISSLLVIFTGRKARTVVTVAVDIDLSLYFIVRREIAIKPVERYITIVCCICILRHRQAIGKAVCSHFISGFGTWLPLSHAFITAKARHRSFIRHKGNLFCLGSSTGYGPVQIAI